MKLMPPNPVGADLSRTPPIHRPSYASTEAASSCHAEPQRSMYVYELLTS
jgi:hypothetical protein